MAGHNKWSSIKHKKGAADAKRGKVFAQLSKEITMAAREGGGDPDKNARLRTAVDSARGSNMPNNNIERAIKKGTGELASGQLEELRYEGYAPGGVAVMVTCLSDNRNRSTANVRAIFSKNNSSLADNGAVAPLFERKARFVVTGEQADEDTLLELLLEAGIDVDDISEEEGQTEILAAPERFAEVAEALQNAGVGITQSGLVMQPYNRLALSDPAAARKVRQLVDALEADDDVQEVYTNAAISETEQEETAQAGVG